MTCKIKSNLFFFLAVCFVFICTCGLNGSAFADAKHKAPLDPNMDSEPVVWHEGKVTKRAWLALDEISVLKGQCLDRRIPSRDDLVREVTAWEADRNDKKATVEWRFTSEKARDKLTRLYPVVEQGGAELTCQN